MLGRACSNYFAKAFSNLWKNRLFSLLSTATIVFCLLLLGIALILGSNITYVSKQLEVQYEIHAYVDLSYSEADAKRLQSKINDIPYVDTATFVSKEEALAGMEESMADSASAFEMLHGEENPLPHTYDITLTDVSKANEVVAEVSKLVGIDEVKNRSDVLNSIINTSRAAQAVSMIGMIIFALVGIFIISSTIKMSVTARQREIEIMKYVGATDWYIRWPFIIEGTVMGIIGALIAYVPVTIGYANIVSWWQSNGAGMFELIPLIDLQARVILIFAIMGCFLGAFGSVISIRKHLKV
ncbi:MAG: permease-like cell division protein FtsX [Clostridia bacterium]|nr:permease-like cell division protein FtsX [Clostridia bacterium]